jgi:hypothetical protein
MDDSLAKVDWRLVDWEGGNVNRLDRLMRYREYSDYVRDFVAPILEALANGSPMGVAASAAGLTRAELVQLLEWGREGHPVWERFREEYLRADGRSIQEVDRSLFERAVGGDNRAVGVFLRRKSREWREIEAEMAQMKAPRSAVVNQQRVEITTDFGRRTEVIDAGVVEEE